jgi:hypothetical protein
MMTLFLFNEIDSISDDPMNCSSENDDTSTADTLTDDEER